MEYPYYIIPDIQKYKSLDPDSEEARKIALRIRVNVGDAEALRRILGENETISSQKPGSPEEEKDSNFSSIDTFLEKFGKNIPSGYAEEIIDTSLPQDDIKTLIKKGRYNEAIALIQSQNLNNPQKSIYFAHQMRFLKKLKAIEKFKHS